MILHRYMSEQEFDAYQAGKVLKNETNHRKNGEHSDSVGFCFFPEQPDEAIHWLRGIVCTDVCVTFDVPDDKVVKSRGTYCDNDASDNSWGAIFEDIIAAMQGEEMKNAVKMEKTEYCCTRYDKKTFKLIDFRYSKTILLQKELLAEWERPTEELPEGVLAQGTMSYLCDLRIHRIIGKALDKTPFAYCSNGVCCDFTPLGGSLITLPDGRYIRDGDRVEIHNDGIVLINGRLFTRGFPNLEKQEHGKGEGNPTYLLEPFNGSPIIVPQSLYQKYLEAAQSGK